MARQISSPVWIFATAGVDGENTTYVEIWNSQEWVVGTYLPTRCQICPEMGQNQWPVNTGKVKSKRALILTEFRKDIKAFTVKILAF